MAKKNKLNYNAMFEEITGTKPGLLTKTSNKAVTSSTSNNLPRSNVQRTTSVNNTRRLPSNSLNYDTMFEDITGMKRSNNVASNYGYGIDLPMIESTNYAESLKQQQKREKVAKKQSDAKAKELGVDTDYISTIGIEPERRTALKQNTDTPKYTTPYSENKKSISAPDYAKDDETLSKQKEFFKSSEYNKYLEETYTTPLYQFYADMEKAKQNDVKDMNWFQKTYTSLFGGINSDSTTFRQQYKTKNEYGETVYVTLPSYNELQTQSIIQNTDSYIGKLYYEAIQSVGQMIPFALANLLPGIGQVASLAMLGASSFANSRNQRLLQGESTSKATSRAALTSAIEVGTETMFGGMGKIFGKGALDDVVIKKITDKVTNRVAKGVVDLGLRSVGEGIEELVGNSAEAIISNIAKDPDAPNLSEWGQETIEEFLVAMMSSVILGSVTTVADTKARVNLDNYVVETIENEQGTKLTDFEKDSIKSQIDTLYENGIRDGEIVLSAIQSGVEDIDTLKLTQYNSLQATINQNENTITELQDHIAALEEKQSKTPSNETAKDIKKLQQQFVELSNEIVAEKIVQDNLKNEAPKTPNLRETALSNNANPFDIYTNGIKNAQDAGIRITEPVKQILTAAANRGINVEFDPNVSESTRGLWKKTGNFDGSWSRTILFNPNIIDAYNASDVFVHELFHDIASSEKGQRIINDVIQFLSTDTRYNDEYIRQRALLEAEYAKLRDAEGRLLYDPNSADFKAKIDEEITAMALAEKLGNKEFIQQLVEQKPSLAKRIYNWIRDLLRRLTGQNTPEYRFWNQVRQNFEEAYQETYNESITGTEKHAESIEKAGKKEYNNDNSYGHAKEYLKLTKKEKSEIQRVVSPLAAKYAGVEESYSTHDVNGNKVVFDIFADTTYRITSIEKTKDIVKEVVDERNPNKNSRHIVENSEQRSRHNRNSNESDRNRRTSKQNAKISTREQTKPKNRVPYKTSGRTNQELDNSSFSLPKDKSLSSQLERQGTRILKEANSKRTAMIDNFKLYLEENNITNPTQEDINNSIVDLLGYDNEQDYAANAKDEKLYNKYVREYMKENNISFNDNSDTRYSISIDNQGRKLTEAQQDYFKDSKARNDKGELVTVYHTMTNEGRQFNEFNPVGTDHYRFGNQVVNYYTDSKEMSGSYANQRYEMADTKRITSMKEVNDFIKKMNEEGWGSYRNYELIQEDGKYKLIDNTMDTNSGKTSKQIYDEANEYKKTLTTEELAQFKDMFENEVRQDGVYDIDAYLKSRGYEFGSKQDEIAHKYSNIDSKNFNEAGIYFDVLMRDAKYHTVETFDNKEDLFKKIKSLGWEKASYQYEGYVNITNPYVVDGKGANWSSVERSVNERAIEDINKLSDEQKTELEQALTEIYDHNNKVSKDYQEVQKILDEFRNIGLYDKALMMDYLAELDNGKTGAAEASLELLKTKNRVHGEPELTKKQVLDKINNEQLTNTEKTIIKENGTGIEAVENINTIKGLYDAIDYKNKYNDFYNLKGTYAEFQERANSIIPENYFEESWINPSDLYQLAENGFNEQNIEKIFATDKSTNDIVKRVIELNKNGSNYDGVILKNVVDYGGKTNQHEANDLYITFNSNQFKAVDNKTPTTDADIRYSTDIGNTNELVGNEGTKTKFERILPKREVKLPKSAEIEQTSKATTEELPFEEVKKPKEKKERVTKLQAQTDTAPMGSKTINQIARNMKKSLALSNGETAEFKQVLYEISQNPNITKNDIKEIIDRRFSSKEIKTRLDDVAEIKKALREYPINVSQEIKSDIADYSRFRQENFGKIRFNKDGASVDTAYQELQEMYPNYFPASIKNPTDQLEQIAYVANLDTYMTENAYLDDGTIEETTDWIYDSIQDYKLAEAVKNNKLSYKEYNKALNGENLLSREEIRSALLTEMGITEDDIAQGKDINSVDLNRTDPIRVNEKVFGAEIGKKINDATINQTKHNEAERTRWLNAEREDIKSLGIKPRSKESAAVQKYGEKEYLTSRGEYAKYDDAALAAEFPNVETQNKIKRAAEVIRNKYDAYIDEINDVLTGMGYKKINKRQDYMRHFQALNDVFSRFGTPLNRESLKSDSLPTDINGLTDQFKPGKQYFASALKRMGMKTEYDAITGIDGYLDGASNLIFHTEDIQRYRTLAKLVRDTYGATHGYDNIDNMSEEEFAKRVEDIQSNKLAKYAAWLDEQANALANKKGKIDRGFEEIFGRKIYGILNTAKKQVGSNMTGYNVRSALTNFASAVQGASKTNKLAFIKGTISTINNIVHNDGLIDKSDFLTSRFGSDSLSQKPWQKISKAGQIFMEGTDYFTANQIWRGKYFENLQKGMTENEAIKNADDFAARIMGDRSKGSTAAMFNSQTLGFLTQFQLEVNNQWSSLIHDNKIDVQRGNKTPAAVMFQVGQLFGLSFMFNNFMKALTGSDVMIDPIDLLKKIFKPDDDDTTMTDRAFNALGEVIDDLPFVSVFTGGRIPMSEAFKGATTLTKRLTGQKDKYGNDIKTEDVKKDLIESALYWILPTGYGQLKKTQKGLAMYDKNLPVAGSYTASGNLRFKADESTAGKIKAALFGAYASKEAQDYINSGFKTISASNLQEMQDLGMSRTEFNEFQSDLKAAKKTKVKTEKGTFQAFTDKYDNWYWYNVDNGKLYTTNNSIFSLDNLKESNKDVNDLKKVSSSENVYGYIMNLNISADKKATLLNKELEKYGRYTEEDIRKNYGSLEELEYAKKNPDWYSFVQQVAPYDEYMEYRDEIKKIRDNTTNDKAETINYINNLNLSIPQKAMFIRTYYKSFRNYDDEIINYINQQPLTIEEKQAILQKANFVIRDGRVYSK